jgi:threonine dehydrogenase-like Zn-dependent dehydrogenase
LHGVARLGDVAGKRVGVLGMGAIGQFAARFLASAPARTVIVRRRRPSALRRAVRAKRSISRGKISLEACYRHRSRRVIEATGNSEEIARCARAVRSGGKIVLLSYYDARPRRTSISSSRKSRCSSRASGRTSISSARATRSRTAPSTRRPLADHVVRIDATRRRIARRSAIPRS